VGGVGAAGGALSSMAGGAAGAMAESIPYLGIIIKVLKGLGSIISNGLAALRKKMTESVNDVASILSEETTATFDSRLYGIMS